MHNRIRGILTDATADELASDFGVALVALAAEHGLLPFQTTEAETATDTAAGTASNGACC